MRRTVITGIGIVSSIGVGSAEVLDALRSGRSGIEAEPTFAEMGMRSQVAGTIKGLDPRSCIDRRDLRFMGEAAIYSHVAMAEAIADAGLGPGEVSSERTALVAGSGGGSTSAVVAAADTLRSRGVKGIGAYAVTKAMCSQVSACLATSFKIKGLSCSVSSACSTSAHCVQVGCDQIALGRADIVFAGGGESADWTIASLFDGMGALSSHFNDTPTKASRAFDARRDGFVMAAGGGIVVLEELSHAKARGARIYAEVKGFGATSDGAGMVAPSGEGAQRCMRQALDMAGCTVDYINAHGTSTHIGDLVELKAIRGAFGEHCPPVSSTKSMTGHALGGAGVNEIIYSLLMLEHGFIAPSINLEEPDPEIAALGIDLVTSTREAPLRAVMSNSFGFGGTNASVILAKPDA
ncbi:MAG: beta-ketoacyl-ACP synthase I [Succinivibrionaceae bacterium]|nr:beta-ketoacyl-ACP synthase I [Succinivibrionaceae bacterium]